MSHFYSLDTVCTTKLNKQLATFIHLSDYRCQQILNTSHTKF